MSLILEVHDMILEIEKEQSEINNSNIEKQGADDEKVEDNSIEEEIYKSEKKPDIDHDIEMIINSFIPILQNFMSKTLYLSFIFQSQLLFYTRALLKLKISKS